MRRNLESKSPSTSEAVLRRYFAAKDENRPHLLAAVFAADAELAIRNASDNIAFPASTRGRGAIADVLVRNFTLSYENVYSFYLARPKTSVEEFACAWLVAMTERSSGEVRVGCGSYAWSFAARPPHLATRLGIDIESMQVLPGAAFDPVFAWVRSLPYPWSSADSALRGIPEIEQLAPIAAFLARRVDGSTGNAPCMPRVCG